MYKSWQIKTGYYGVVSNPKTILGKAIALFTGGYSHTINFKWGIYEGRFGLWVFEMKQLKGDHDCKRTLYIESEYYKKDNWILKAPVTPFTEIEQDRLSYILDYAYQNCGYDIVSLFRHLAEYVTGKFPIEYKPDKKIVCSHLTGWAVNNARPYTFVRPECLNPRHCAINPNFYTVKKIIS